MRWQQGRARIKKPGKQNCCKIEPQTPGNECPEHKRNVAKSRNGETDENIWKIRLFEKSRRLVPGKRPGKRNGLQIGAKRDPGEITWKRTTDQALSTKSFNDWLWAPTLRQPTQSTKTILERKWTHYPSNCCTEMVKNVGDLHQNIFVERFCRKLKQFLSNGYVERLCRTLCRTLCRKLKKYWSNTLVENWNSFGRMLLSYIETNSVDKKQKKHHFRHESSNIDTRPNGAFFVLVGYPEANRIIVCARVAWVCRTRVRSQFKGGCA